MILYTEKVELLTLKEWFYEKSNERKASSMLIGQKKKTNVQSQKRGESYRDKRLKIVRKYCALILFL